MPDPRSHRSLKTLLIKQNKKRESVLPMGTQHRPYSSISNTLHILLYTLNFVTLIGEGYAPYQRHFGQHIPLCRPLVYYRELSDPAWHGPIPLLTWGRGHAAVLSPAGTVWVLAQCVKPAKHVMAQGAAESSAEIPDVPRPSGADSQDSAQQNPPASLPNHLGRPKSPHQRGPEEPASSERSGDP